MFQNQVFLKQCKAKCFTPPPPRWQSKPTGLVLALVAAFVLFSACRSGNSEEITEIIDNPGEPPVVPTVMITVGSDYTGAIKVNYLEKPASTSTTTKSISGTIADGAVQLASYPPKGSLIVSIQAGSDTNPAIYIGRLIGSSAVSLKLKLNNLGNLELRPADSGIIPIGTYSEFQLINNNDTTRVGSYKQEADLDLMGDSGLGVPDWEPVGTSSTAAFTGNFDGDGKQIKRLHVDNDTKNYVGLFGYAAVAATFTGVHIASGSVTGKDYVGGLLGCISAGTISDCSNAADITGTGYVGGVAGLASSAMTECSNSGTITGGAANVGGVAGKSYANMTLCSNSGKIDNSSGYTGGVVGFAAGGADYDNRTYILGCSNTGDVTASSGGNGGILGSGQAHVSITACYNKGNITNNNTTTGHMTGGIFGGTFAAAPNGYFYLTACYNTGEVNGKQQTGGIAGLFGSGISSSSLTACYSTGKVTGDSDVNGILGMDFVSSTTVTDCYWKANGTTSPGTGTGYKEITGAYFTPSTTDSAEWGTGDGSGSGKYWKAGSTSGSMLPKLWYEK